MRVPPQKRKGKKKDNMDDYMFRSHVVGCKVVHELTGYLEILNYSVSSS